jgi:spore germination cell wall hydrolase CwlJ-like protein
MLKVLTLALGIGFLVVSCDHIEHYNTSTAAIISYKEQLAAKDDLISSLVQTVEDQRKELNRPSYEDVLYLAATLYGEARNQDREGLDAVAATIVNRAKDGNYGKGIVGVVLKYKQFSCWNPWDKNYWKVNKFLEDPDPYFLEVAEEAIKNPTHNYLFYHATSMTPYWVTSSSKGEIIGDHKFYRSL